MALTDTRSRIFRRATARLRMLPDFIILGGKKCGTTALYRYLKAHHAVGAPWTKEVHFFDYGFERGPGWYRAHFPLGAERRWVALTRRHRFITGEASPYYLFHPCAPARIRRVAPRAGLIALLRNPVDRAYSDYQQQTRKGHESLSFEEAIEREGERLEGQFELVERGLPSDRHRCFSYLARGVYVDQLQHWTRFFSRGQILVVNSSDLWDATRATMERVQAFLGIPSWHPDDYRKHYTHSYAPMAAGTRQRLADYFRPHNERLYDFLGERFEWDR